MGRVEHIFILGLLASNLSSASKLVNRLNGKHLRVWAANFPPTITVIRNETGDAIKFTGGIFEELDYISKRLNFTFTLKAPAENTAGFKINGTWIGLAGRLAAGEGDLALGPFAFSLERHEVIDVAGLMGGDSVAGLVRYPEQEQISAWATLKPFTPSVWLGFLLGILAVILVCVFLVRIKAKLISVSLKLKYVDDMIIYTVATMTAQGESYRAGHRSIGILAGFWCLVAFVYVNTYNTTLISYLSVHSKAPEINSLDQLISSSRKLLTLRGSYTDLEILSATSGKYKLLGDKLRKCPQCRLDDFSKMGKLVIEERHFLFLPSLVTAKGLMQRDYQAVRKCRMTLANIEYRWKPLFFGVPKKSLYKEEINREMLWVHAFGFVNKWAEIGLDKNLNRCFLKYNLHGYQTERTSSRLILKQFTVPFFILLTGFLLATAAFIYEKIRYHLVGK